MCAGSRRCFGDLFRGTTLGEGIRFPYSPERKNEQAESEMQILDC